MKLSQSSDGSDRDASTLDPTSDIQSPISNLRPKSEAWLRWAMWGGVLVIVFLAGVLFARAGGAATPTTLPAVHGLTILCQGRYVKKERL